jgi:hypothetical protein
MLLHIANGTIANNETWEIAQNLQSYSSSCVVGTVCGLSGQMLHEDTFNVTRQFVRDLHSRENLAGCVIPLPVHCNQHHRAVCAEQSLGMRGAAVRSLLL